MKIYHIMLYLFCLVAAKVIVIWKKREIWLITHTKLRWGDNAQAFYNYLKYNHPEIDIYAVLDRANIEQVDKQNRLLHSSLKANIFIMLADVLASTHMLNYFGPHKLLKTSPAIKVWLKHGVTGIKKLYLSSKHEPYDIICVGSEKEKDLFINQLNIPGSKLKVTGYARHDLLKEKNSKITSRTGVLFIPTKRDWLDNDDREIYETILFSWINKLKQYNLSIPVKLWLHPGWYKQDLNDIKVSADEMVDVKTDPQDLLLNTKLLVTDYSSIFFDAALCGVPTIFYQPDRSEFIKMRGLFSDFAVQRELSIIEEEEPLIKNICLILNDDNYHKVRLEKDRSWASTYVTKYDGLSSERIYLEIREQLDNRQAI